MIFSFGIRVYVKFRVLLVTLGTFDRSLSVTYSPTSGFGFSTASSTPTSGVSTLVNERGVLVQAWA
jgi:hypothetical protein